MPGMSLRSILLVESHPISKWSEATYAGIFSQKDCRVKPDNDMSVTEFLLQEVQVQFGVKDVGA